MSKHPSLYEILYRGQRWECYLNEDGDCGITEKSVGELPEPDVVFMPVLSKTDEKVDRKVQNTSTNYLHFFILYNSLQLVLILHTFIKTM